MGELPQSRLIAHILSLSLPPPRADTRKKLTVQDSYTYVYLLVICAFICGLYVIVNPGGDEVCLVKSYVFLRAQHMS